jgi:hypothetical protein
MARVEEEMKDNRAKAVEGLIKLRKATKNFVLSEEEVNDTIGGIQEVIRDDYWWNKTTLLYRNWPR